MAHTTTTSAKAWSPDLHVFDPGDSVPQSLILRAATVAGTIEGDEPRVRIAWANDAAATFVPEGAEIPEADPTLDEVTVATGKVSQLLRVSREQHAQAGAAGLLSQSVARAITRKADEAFMGAEGEGVNDLDGILRTAGVHTGTIGADLDALADAFGEIEAAGGSPSVIVASPSAWSALRKLKTGEGSSAALLGAGSADQERLLFGVPVVTSPSVPAGDLAVVDATAVAAAVGTVQVATSYERFFESDSVALRATWRIGWAVQHADRLAKLTVGSADEG